MKTYVIDLKTCVTVFFVSLNNVMEMLQSNRRTIMDDPFIRNYIEDLLKNVRTQVLLKLIKPYTRIRIPFISKVKTSFFCLAIPIYVSYFHFLES